MQDLDLLRSRSCPGLSEEEKDLTEADVAAYHESLTEWEQTENENGHDALARAIAFDGFDVAIAFVNTLASLAESEGHHPDIDIRYNTVLITLSTHDAGGLTLCDFILAAKIDTLV